MTVSGSDLSDGSVDEDELDNYNSAGEEIEDDEFEESQNEFSPKPGEEREVEDCADDFEDDLRGTPFREKLNS